MRVLLDCRMATWSGVGRYTLGLTRALAARGDLELVAVVSADGEPLLSNLAEERFRVVHGSHSPFSPLGSRELGRIAGRVAPDVVHCLHFPTPWPASHPLVVTLHDLTPLLVDDVMPSAPRRVLYRRMNARAARIADRIVTPSSHTRSDVERMFPAASGKVRVTLAAADDFSAGSIGEIPASALSPGTPYVLTMGNTRPNKDLPTLLAAFEQFAAAHPDVHLLLVGQGDPVYLAARLSSALRRVVRFTGRVDDAQLRALYAGASAFAFPSTYEGFGLPPLEAMSLGAPVVVSDAASLPEVVGDAALVVPSGDVDGFASALSRILDDAALRDDLVRRGRARAAEFTWAATAEATVAVYREVGEAT